VLSDLEILSLSDRIGVLYRGQLAGIYEGTDATREQLGLLMASGASSDMDVVVG
jgi:simple sugar transport system ATP-binding protein